MYGASEGVVGDLLRTAKSRDKAFVAKLHRQFEGRRQELLAKRAARQQEFDAGKLPDFLPETQKIRESTSSVRVKTLAIVTLTRSQMLRTDGTNSAAPPYATTHFYPSVARRVKRVRFHLVHRRRHFKSRPAAPL